jgi:5-methylcytosine-specific restriction endonuclease McrA
MPKKCIVDACSKKAHAKDYCSSHYAAWRRYGDPLVRRQKRNYCQIDDCQKPVNGHGMCAMHYRRWKVHGDVHHVASTSPGTWTNVVCSVFNCQTEVSGIGMCAVHLARFRRHGDPLITFRAPNRTYGQRLCDFNGCDVIARTRGLCSKHYRQANAARYALHSANRRAAKRQRSAGDIPWGAIQSKFVYWGNRCWMCGTSERLTIDHVKPLSKGGWHVLANIRPACLSCNCSKNNKWLGLNQLTSFSAIAS